MKVVQENDPAGHSGHEHEVRHAMVDAARRLVTLGLNCGASGNIGVRLANSFLVTPSGVAVEQLCADGMVEMDYSGAVIGSGKPSSEWRFHRDILLARPQVGAIVHTHSRHATALACQLLDVPAFHYMIAAAGGDSIRCAPYALFGTQELSDHALQALQGRQACLLGHHGMLALGADLAGALAMALEVETLCEQYWSVLQLGAPKLLSAAQMQLVLEKFKSYGPRGKD